MAVVLLAAFLLFIYVTHRFVDHLYRSPRLCTDNRFVLITGCDSGFGHKLARRLDSLGCNVFAACLTSQGEELLKKEASTRLVTVRLDVTQHDDVTRVYNTVKNKLDGRELWGLVSNAGIAAPVVPVEFTTIDTYRSTVDVNLLGLIDMTLTFLPLLRRTGGRIVNVSSIFGRVGAPGGAAYSVSKYGVEAFSDCMRRELISAGLHVAILEPGFFKTEITSMKKTKRSMEALFNGLDTKLKEACGPEYLQRAFQIEEEFSTTVPSPDTHLVTDAMEHALFAVHPRARYVVGHDARYKWIPLSWLPEWMSDKYLQAYLPEPVPESYYSEN